MKIDTNELFKEIISGIIIINAFTSRTNKKLIKESIPDASVEIKDLMGDNNHYAATIKSKLFNNLNKIDQHKLVYVT